MSDMSREELQARFAAFKATVDAAVAGTDANYRHLVAISDERMQYYYQLGERVLVLAESARRTAERSEQTAERVERNIGQMRQDFQSAEAGRSTLIVTAVSCVIANLAIAVSLYLGIQQSNLSFAQTIIAALESGRSHK